MINIEKLVDVALELRIATLRARGQGIISYVDNADEFQIYDEKQFVILFRDKKYTLAMSGCKEFPYEYKGIIDGLRFITLTKKLLFEGDENKIESEEI